MACAYSQNYLATSPLTRAAPIPFKRVPSAKSAVPASQSRSGVNHEGSLVGDDFFNKKYSLSTSGRRRSVASSPTDSAAASVPHSVPTAATTTYGFAPSSAFSAPSTSALGESSFTFSRVPPARPPKSQAGGLSRALSNAEKVGVYTSVWALGAVVLSGCRMTEA